MQGKLLLVIITLLISKSVISQRKIDLTIVLDKSMDAKKVSCSYFNGKKDIIVKDTFSNNTLRLSDSFYSPFVSFHIEYAESGFTSYVNDFFINEKTAKIAFHLKTKGPNNLLGYPTIVNATPIYDTNSNKTFKELVLYRKKEAQAVSDFWDKHGGEIYASDSLMLLNRSLFKLLNDRTLSFVKKHAQNYFAFWYFRTQVIEPSVAFFKKDTSYLESLITSLKSIFPSKYSESIEGQRMTELITGLIAPPMINSIAPQFIIEDINQTSVQLTNFKGKYVLLDFWASWCPPCMREMPFLKKIRNRFSADKLVIIGINKDRDINTCKSVITKNTLNWVHIFDEENKIQSLFGVKVFPTTILINAQGVIIYNSSEKENKEQLLSLLTNMEDDF